MATQYVVTSLLTDCTAVMLLSCCCHAAVMLLSCPLCHALSVMPSLSPQSTVEQVNARRGQKLFSVSHSKLKLLDMCSRTETLKDRRDNELEDKYGYCQNYSEHCTVQKSRLRLFPCSQCAELCAECAGRTVTIATSSDQPRHRATALPRAQLQPEPEPAAMKTPLLCTATLSQTILSFIRRNFLGLLTSSFPESFFINNNSIFLADIYLASLDAG